jgi:hypothetical protein
VLSGESQPRQCVSYVDDDLHWRVIAAIKRRGQLKGNTQATWVDNKRSCFVLLSKDAFIMLTLRAATYCFKGCSAHRRSYLNAAAPAVVAVPPAVARRRSSPPGTYVHVPDNCYTPTTLRPRCHTYWGISQGLLRAANLVIAKYIASKWKEGGSKIPTYSFGKKSSNKPCAAGNWTALTSLNEPASCISREFRKHHQVIDQSFTLFE